MVMYFKRDMVFYLEQGNVIIKEPKDFIDNFKSASKKININKDDIDLESFAGFVNEVFKEEMIDVVTIHGDFVDVKKVNIDYILNGRTLTMNRAKDILEYITDTVERCREYRIGCDENDSDER